MPKKLLTLTFLITLLTPLAHAQEVAEEMKAGFLGRFNYGANRLMQLAEALPEETFAFQPGDGAMSMERVFMHIIRYNYLYPEMSMGVDAPAGIDLDNLEDMTGKAAVLAHLEDSIEHVRTLVNGMSAEDLTAKTELYGGETIKLNVLMQLQAHMAEHLGQLLAYTRMNNVTPPWSR